MSKNEVKAIAKKQAKKTAAKVAEKAAKASETTPAKASKPAKKKAKSKAITSRIVNLKIKGLGVMPVAIYSTTYKEETFEHTDKKEVKAWRKERKQADKKPVDPEKLANRLTKQVTRAIKVLGEDTATDVLNNALNAS